MRKEIIIILIVILLVIVLNFVTERYTNNSLEELRSNLESVRSSIKEERENDRISQDMKITRESWKDKYNKLAYYIEHDELEKIELYLVGLETNISEDQYSEAFVELERCIFILEHIEEKYNFNLKNIF